MRARTRSTKLFRHGSAGGSAGVGFPSIEAEIEGLSGEALSDAECVPPAVADRALLIYTSGTTGLPKAAKINHYRLLIWSLWFAGMMDTKPSDRMYGS